MSARKISRGLERISFLNMTRGSNNIVDILLYFSSIRLVHISRDLIKYVYVYVCVCVCVYGLYAYVYSDSI